MAKKLIPLNEIPYGAREREASERATWPTRAMAQDAATIKIIDALGSYDDDNPRVLGWVLTIEAAEAMSDVRTSLPGGSVCGEYDYETGYFASKALGEYMEAIARGMPQEAAVAAYNAARGAL